MIDIIKDTLIDSIKLLPFLFFAFLIIELFEHKFSKKIKHTISKTEKFGSIIGGVLGVIPQCGFSVMATNLYITRIITLGTLISIYLSTSDEMLPILLSNNVEISVILKILLTKLFIGIICGILIDFILNKGGKNKKQDYHICSDEHCNCTNSIIKSTITHTLNTLLFIVIITFILNILFEYTHDYLSKIFLNNTLLTPFITSLLGLIPNCASSVLLSELYLNNIIDFSSLIAGLLTNSGVAILVLFKSNKNKKENLTILGLVYIIGVISGIAIKLLNIIF